MTSPLGAAGVHTVIGVDAGSANLREADHLIHHLVDGFGLPRGTVACTHLIRTDERRSTAVSLALPDAGAAEVAWTRVLDWAGPDTGAAFGDRTHGSAQAAGAARLAAEEHAGRRAGRAVSYPGVDALVGTVTVADLLGLSAVDRVVVVGAPSVDGAGPDPATAVRTRDHVRPEWRDGRLTLALVPAVGGALAPFEVPNPTPCCADHG
ncbi:hypothetical protein FNH09_06675 [Streptomyces adustus]|uniref:Uncharacterized protein n=1 Tax=Streptomyces adustus TaxID=1609272 RepID=A0A5N8V8Q8_9ACTN|nr:hypothetical protein [Streptomyces adustus]MPY31012.1 hypothetical protein [Streptomyces adustus]